MVSNIKEGDTAYWKHTQDFGIVTRVAVDSEDIQISICWCDQSYSSESFIYRKGDLDNDGQLVIGKLAKLFYAPKP